MQKKFNIIDYLKETHGITGKTISEDLNVTPAFISNLKKDKPIGLELAKKIAAKYGLTIEFVTGNTAADKKLDSISPEKKSKDEAPYLENINASAGLNFLTNNGDATSYIKIPGAGVDVYINVFGDSMYPKYCSGEIIGIRKLEKDMVFFGNAYVIEMADGEAYIKYIFPGKDDEHWELRSENPKFPSRQFHLDKIGAVYKIKATVSKNSL